MDTSLANKRTQCASLRMIYKLVCVAACSQPANRLSAATQARRLFETSVMAAATVSTATS
eukprot:6213830-Pleurochrysis_carterae.AAC.2